MKHQLSTYTDASKTEKGMGSGTVTGKIFKVDEKYTNKQEEQLEILKANHHVKKDQK